MHLFKAIYLSIYLTNLFVGIEFAKVEVYEWLTAAIFVPGNKIYIEQSLYTAIYLSINVSHFFADFQIA